jgi:predicted transcriptional regulator
MKRKSGTVRIGDLQLRILKELWARGSAPVATIHAALSERRLAYTTIATMLRKMEERGLVAHKEEGRTFIYHALLQAEEVNRNASRHFVEQLFEGSLSNAVSHLLQTCNASRAELAELEKAVAEAKRRAK